MQGATEDEAIEDLVSKAEETLDFIMLHRFASVRLPTGASEVGVPSVLTVLGVPESGAAKSRFTVFSELTTGKTRTSS